LKYILFSAFNRRHDSFMASMSDCGVYDLTNFVQDVWQRRVSNYWKLLGNKIKPDTIRNVMDMKANLGSFAAALKDKDVWVMNVVPENGPNTLKIIYDRGLLGTVHNWYGSYIDLLCLYINNYSCLIYCFIFQKYYTLL